MSSDYVELFWALLEDGNFEQLKKSVPKDFNWTILHPTHKITILVAACNHFDFGMEGRPDEKDVLETIGWLTRSGASYTQKCGKSTSSSMICKGDSEALKVPYANHSVLSYVQAWQDKLCDKPDWRPEFKYLRKVLDVIAKASTEHARPRASIDEGIVEIWEKYLQASESHDLMIQTPDGSVTCHARMLMEASPVVRAMLSTPMKEGTSQKIQLQDASSNAVQLFVDILYTCSSCSSDPIDWKAALSALDLAHRWQVEAVVAILADLLQTMLSEESFSAIAELAALKELAQLVQHCQKFGAANAAIQKQIKDGQLPKVVQALFEADPPSAPPAKKQRKRL